MESKTFSDTPYFVGVDIGTDSVGYAATDKNYAPLKYRGETMLGVTLFDPANGCADRRAHRTSRRRYDRRQTRVDLVQELLCHEVAKVDPAFFTKLNESFLLECDRSADAISGCEWNDSEYNRSFPTIHHLIVHLMGSAEGLDIRYIYLAVAWLVAHRGHFLSDIDGERVEELTDIAPVYAEFVGWFSENGYELPWSCEPGRLFEVLTGRGGVKRKEEALRALLFGCKKPAETDSPIDEGELVRLLAGGKVSVKKLIRDDELSDSDDSLQLDDPDGLEAVLPELGSYAELVRSAAAVYDCCSLARMLGVHSAAEPIPYISEIKVKQYEAHRQELRDLKRLVRKYCPEEYKATFRDTGNSGYADYSSHVRKKDGVHAKRTTRENFYKFVEKLLKKMAPETDADRLTIEGIRSRIEDNTYMPKQVNGDNRLIPHQLYYAELRQILANAEKCFPSLAEKDEDGLTVSDKIKSVFNFRIPYYVGPLNKKSSHAWLERRAEKIFPWSFDSVVDLDASEEGFIRRMTNKCTYLPGEPVLPAASLLYTRCTILSTINKIKVNGRPIDVGVKQELYNSLFRKNSRVTFRKLADFLISNGILRKGEEDQITGIDKTVSLSAKSISDFSRLISSGILTEGDAEEIILRLTCTEDKARFAKWLDGWCAKLGRTLSPEDRKYIISRNYKDFGSLSRRLLNGIEGVNTRTGECGTVLHFLWESNDNLMQILADRTSYTFCEAIEKEKQEYFSDNPRSLTDRLEEMRISNAVKRPVIRTLDIISDIVKARGRAPEKIFVEMARGATEEQKNKRTVSRRDQILDLYKSISSDDLPLLRRELDELGEDANERLQSTSLYLYFTQLGRCMYCEEPLRLSDLGTDEYNIDHIWPQAYIKDDSLSNKVLVHSSENHTKTDIYPIPAEWRSRMYGFWQKLHTNKLISDEKFNRLTRGTPFTNEEKQGFINRQLVETRQSTKAVTELLREKYPDTEIVYVKAGAVSDFRHEYGEIKSAALKLHLTNEEKNEMSLIKSRTASDIHHAQDAYLNIVVGNLFHEKFTRAYFSVSDNAYSLNFKTLFGRPFDRDPSVWEPVCHLAAVDRAMANPHIHLTKYQTKQTGGFYKQNPLPAGSGNLVPLKTGLATENYGGYDKPAVSFYVLVRYKSGKKYELTICPCELTAADSFLSDPDFAAEYIRKRLPDNATDISKPLGDRILKINTVFSLDGFEVCISGKTGNEGLFRSLETVYYPSKWIRYIKRIEGLAEKRKKNSSYVINEKYDGVTTEKNIEFFDYLVRLINGVVFSKLPGAKLCISCDKKGEFITLSLKEQLDCLENMILYLKTNRSGGCNMTSIKGSKKEGIIRLSLDISNWKKKYSDVRIIDRSASGLFEKRSDNLLDLI